MIIQLETADVRSEPDDYAGDLSVMEHEYTWDENPPLTETVYLVEVDGLDALMEQLEYDKVVVGPPGSGSDYDDAEWVVTIYDYYIE